MLVYLLILHGSAALHQQARHCATDWSERLYKKHAACLGLLVGLLLPVSLLANQQATQDALREAFSGHATACTAALPAVALQAPGLLHEFYAQRQFVPLWQDAGRRLDLLHELQQLADDGLDLAPYQLSLLQAQLQRQADSQAEACAELLASHSYLLALQHLYQGRLPLEQRESLWRAESLPASTRPSLLSIAWQGLDKVANAFAAARPSQPHYLQLRRAYASLRQQSPAEWPLIEAGRLLKPGMHDPRIPILIQRLQADGYLPADTPSATLYSESVASAVRQFQQLHGLQDDAIIGADTLAALNQPFAARLEQLRANLERWRWLSAEMEPDLLLVDIAGGLLSYYQGGQLQWQGRTQVGRAVRQTPQLKSRVNRLTLNPDLDRPADHPARRQAAGNSPRHRIPRAQRPAGTRPAGQPAGALLHRLATSRTDHPAPGRRAAEPTGQTGHPLPQPVLRIPARHPQSAPVREITTRVQLRLRAGRRHPAVAPAAA